jgi:deoxyribodipyrimidine photo-lyase
MTIRKLSRLGPRTIWMRIRRIVGPIYTLKRRWKADPPTIRIGNACQKEMVYTGYMQGYMRMYWGKKVIEWTQDWRAAWNLLMKWNDKYELDGRDPNGYAGVAWCFGMHDRPWAQRPVFGAVRYMNDKGLRRKFDIEAYVRDVNTRIAEVE